MGSLASPYRGIPGGQRTSEHIFFALTSLLCNIHVRRARSLERFFARVAECARCLSVVPFFTLARAGRGRRGAILDRYEALKRSVWNVHTWTQVLSQEPPFIVPFSSHFMRPYVHVDYMT